MRCACGLVPRLNANANALQRDSNGARAPSDRKLARARTSCLCSECGRSLTERIDQIINCPRPALTRTRRVRRLELDQAPHLALSLRSRQTISGSADPKLPKPSIRVPSVGQPQRP